MKCATVCNVTPVVSDNIVLRVPILYGPVEYLDESAVTTLFSSVKNVSKDCKVNNVQRRFPTHTSDVASVLKDLISLRLKVCFNKDCGLLIRSRCHMEKKSPELGWCNAHTGAAVH